MTRLVRQMLKIDIDKGSRFTDWARRPLSDSQLSYALADVTHLARLYPLLLATAGAGSAAGLGVGGDGGVWPIRRSTTSRRRMPGSG